MKSYTQRVRQAEALQPLLKEIESLVHEIVPDANTPVGRKIVRKRIDLLSEWLAHELGNAVEPRPISVYDGVLLVAGPHWAKKRAARGFRNAYVDILLEKGPLMGNAEVATLDRIAAERGL